DTAGRPSGPRRSAPDATIEERRAATPAGNRTATKRYRATRPRTPRPRRCRPPPSCAGSCGAEQHGDLPSRRSGPPFRVLLLEREDLLPVGLHADDDPVVGLRLVERLVEPADVRLAIIRELALGVVVAH